MKTSTRISVAGICAAIVNNKRVSSVYCHTTSGHTSITADVQNGRVTGYDYASSCNISGSLPNIYHYGDSHHIQIRAEGNRIRGYDYGSGNHFTAMVNGRNVQLYDYDGSGYTNYTVS